MRGENYQLNADVAAVTQSQYNQLIAAASDKRAGDLHAAELARVDALAAARVAWTGEMGAAQVTEAAGFGSADKTLADAQHDADIQFAQSQAGAIAGQQRAGASLSKTLDDASAAAVRVWAKHVAQAGKNYGQLLAGDDAAFALHQAQNQDAYDLAADTSYKTALVSWSAGLSGQNALLAGYLVNVATDALARDNELAPAWEQLTQAFSAADVARANAAAAADKTLADDEADSSFTYATASDTATSTQAGELADADQLQSVAIATADANRARAGAYAEAAYNVKTAQAEAAYANTAAADGALWESIAEAKHRASQWTLADGLLFDRADEARDNGDNAAEVVRVQALGLAAVERTQSLGDADVAQVTAIQDAKLASTRSAATAANHLATSQKDASHDLTDSDNAAQTSHDHTLAVADKTWTHDGDVANAIYSSASADADTHYGDAQAADEASYQVAAANAAANLITDQSSFNAVYAHAKAGWFLGLSTPSTPGGLSPYVAYSHAMSLANKADSLAVSAAEATYDDTVSDDAVTLSDSTSSAAALRQKNDSAAENAFSVTETNLQGLREIAAVQADRTLSIQVAGAKRDFTIASAKADITQAVADSQADQSRVAAIDAAWIIRDRAVIETPAVNYGKALTNALIAAATQFSAAQAFDHRMHDQSVGDAGLELVTKQADANVTDITQLAQADAALQQGEASGQKDLNIALADDAKAEASTDAAAQLLRDQFDAAASKLANTIETAAGAVQSHALAVATTGLWTAKAAQQFTTDAAVAASADAATAAYAPLARYLSDRASAMASWTTDLVSHYVTYTDSQSALVATESSNDATAQETNSDSWSAQEASASQQISTAQDTHDRAVTAADSAFAQAVAPLTVAYQAVLATAQRAFVVGQATAQRALDLGGTQATFDAAVISLKQALLAAKQSAAADYSSTEFPFEKVGRTARINADEQLGLESDRIDAERQTAEAEAIKTNFDTNILERKNRATGQAVLDLGYTLWKASGLESTLDTLATNHPSAWATEQKTVEHARYNFVQDEATGLFVKVTSIANTDKTQQLAETDAETTLQEDTATAVHDASDRLLITTRDRAIAEVTLDDLRAQLFGYNATHPQDSPQRPISTKGSLNIPGLHFAPQPGTDDYYSTTSGGMFSSPGNYVGPLSKFNGLKLLVTDVADRDIEVTKTPATPDPATNHHQSESQPANQTVAARSVGIIYSTQEDLAKKGVTDYSIGQWQKHGYKFDAHDFVSALGLTPGAFELERTTFTTTEGKGIAGLIIRNTATGETWYGVPEVVYTWKGGFYPGQKGVGAYWRSWFGDAPEQTGTLAAGMTFYNRYSDVTYNLSGIDRLNAVSATLLPWAMLGGRAGANAMSTLDSIAGAQGSAGAPRRVTRSDAPGTSGSSLPKGQWTSVNESMSARARAYQEQITGRTGQAYVVQGVKFDGATVGGLIEAKGPGYAAFVANGQFRPFFRGAEELVKQARKQVFAANGTPIIWHVAEAKAATAMENLLRQNNIKGISILHTPFIP